MIRRSWDLVACALLICRGLGGQEAASAFSVPITISGDVRDTHTQSIEHGQPKSPAAGFRVVSSPTLKLGSHWFAYSAFEAHSSSYFPYQTGSTDENQPVQFEIMQAFIGYTTTISRVSLLIKAGQLSSAFGLFPLEYDDAKMPLIDPPSVYTSNLPLRTDQIPCGVNDLLGQPYGSEVEYGCGGSDAERYGLLPVTLYGLPSIEAELSFSRLDARLQISNSSPANPQGLGSKSQFVQWTGGAGYTFAGGLHVGMSGFRGPYLDRSLTPLLPAGTTSLNFPASGLGMDAQWSRGAWSAQGEWERFHFESPGFVISPTENAAYIQVKQIVSPRLFLAMRATAQHFGRIEDSSGISAGQFAGPQQLYELTVGYRLNRQELLKLGGGWTHRSAWSANGWYWPRAESYAFEAQLVTSFTAVSKAVR